MRQRKDSESFSKKAGLSPAPNTNYQSLTLHRFYPKKAMIVRLLISTF